MDENTLHIYTRVSTDVQKEEGTSLQTQKDLGTSLGNKLGYPVKIWDEGSQSSSKDDLDNRPVLVELLGEVQKGNVRHLYVWNTDRLSRNDQTWSMIKVQLARNNVLLYSGEDSSPKDFTNPQDELLINLLSSISSYDNKIRTERFRLGKLNRIRGGGWLGGPPPYGYQIIDKKLVPNPDEVKWVELVYESYNNGKSFDDIKTELLANGVKTRRNKPVWSHGSLQQLLRNTHYQGFYNVTDKKSGETIRCECEPILSPTLINEVRIRQEENSHKTNTIRKSWSKRNYLLRGLLYCGNCGGPFGGRTNANQYLSHYYCTAKETKWKNKNTDKYKDCGKFRRSLKIEETDKLVWETVIDVLSKSHLFKEETKQEFSSGFHQSKSTDIQKVEKDIKKVDTEIHRIEGLIVDTETDRLLKNRTPKQIKDIMSNLETALLDLKSRRERLQVELDEGKKDQRWVDWLKEFGNKIDSLLENDLNVEEKQRFLNGVLDKIVVNTDPNKQTHKLNLNFTLPYVNDELEWIKKGNTKKTYKIKGGKKKLTVSTTSKKK